jgi:hypothetical protein
MLYSEGTTTTDYAIITGESYDPQTGLVYLRARYYSHILTSSSRPMLSYQTFKILRKPREFGVEIGKSAFLGRKVPCGYGWLNEATINNYFAA